MSKSPAAIIYDSTGANPVSVVVDGITYRLAVDAKVTASALPSGAATEATLATLATEATVSTLLSEANFDARVNTLGQKTMAGSTPVVVASDQSDVPVSQGAAAALAGCWPAKLTDGTNGPVAVRPSLSQALSSDPSLVVQISPNQQPIPTTVVPATSVPGSSIGRASALTAGTFAPVRQTTYVEQTTQAQRSIVSTSAADSAAGTGARQVKITYYNATCAGPFTEIVTMNGLTPVNTVATNICFIERIDVLTVGANGSNVGTLNLYTGTGATGTIFAAIGVGNIALGVGDNETLYAHHYVATGKIIRGYVVNVGIIAAAGGGDSVTVLRARDPTSPTSPFIVVSDFVNAAQGNSVPREYAVSIQIPGPLVIVAFVTPGKNNSTAFAAFDWSEQ